MKSFVVIGLGLFGSHLARDLYDAGHPVLALDCKEELVESISDYIPDAVTVDAKKRDALIQLGVGNYDCAVVALTGDLATSVLITMNLKALKVPEIICKVHDEADKEVLETLGATACIIPEHVAAYNLSKKLTSKSLIDYIQIADDCGIVELTVPQSWINKSVCDLLIRSKYGINLIGIRRNGITRVDFNPSDPLLLGDKLMLLGHIRNLDVVQKL